MQLNVDISKGVAVQENPEMPGRLDVTDKKRRKKTRKVGQWLFPHQFCMVGRSAANGSGEVPTAAL